MPSGNLPAVAFNLRASRQRPRAEAGQAGEAVGVVPRPCLSRFYIYAGEL